LNKQIIQLHYANGTITRSEPEAVTKSAKEVAVIFHIFYIDLWPEIREYLEKLETPYDLFVTVPEHMPDEKIVTLFETHPDIHVYKTENRGRDVLPFLLVMDIIGTDTYPYICKLHSKKTGDSPLGHVWRKLLYFDLIGSDQTVKKILSMFKTDPNIGMITGKNTILDSERYDYGNTAKIDKLVDMSGFLFQDSYLFAGGTMFWVRAELIEPILTLFREGKLNFEKEKGQKDNTLAHAIERFFGIICHVKNKTIAPSPSHYSQLDDETLDEVAKLVLSQQYHGKDIFAQQKREIEELRELADLKKRFKNKIQQHVPAPLFSLLKNSKRALSALKNNPDLLKKVFFYLKRGEIRYLIQKINEKSQNNLARYKTLVKLDPLETIKPFKQRHFSLGEHCIDIVIPVYNGFDYLEALFDSIERYTTTPYRLIIINDASPDERVVPFLEERLKKHPDALFINHTENLGFVKSVNEAVTHVNDHFIILNTDTEVPAFWVERLMYPIIHMENVASTTPFTNAGQIASFPKFIDDNEIFEGMEVNALDKVFRNVNAEVYYEEIPTGVGFCMGVNHNLVKEIGFFDEETFGKGYGEENDWCQRAIKHGYKNLLVPNLFVYHKHGGSFSSEEKKRLMQENGLKLLKRYPDYDRMVQTYVQKDPHHDLRQLLVMIASSKTDEGIHLIIDHALGGGANHYAQERFENDYLAGKKALYVQYDFYANRFVCQFRYNTYTFDFYMEFISGLEHLLREMTFQEVFVNSLVSYRETPRMLALLKELSEVSNADLIIPIHDYYPVCPNFTLLNEKDTFCQIPDNFEACKTCLQHSGHEWKAFGNADADISIWRKDWYALLETATTLLCFSESSKTILLKAYPHLDPEKIEVKPHSVKPLPTVPHTSQTVQGKTTIGILGAINHAKGAGMIKALVKAIEEKGLNIDVVLIGEISEFIKSPHFKVTGRYDREQLPQIITQEQIDIFLIPSICPETFSYTTQEIMMMQMPLMVFDVGAPAERVREYEKGYVLSPVSVNTILQTISTFQSQSKG